MRECINCKYIQGDECMRYTGPTSAACGLVSGAWYKINDLIAALLCFSNINCGGSGSCENCICLQVDAVNYAASWGSNSQVVLKYQLYSDAAHTNQIVSREVSEGVTNKFTISGSLPYSKVYPTFTLDFVKADPENTYYTNGYGVDLIIVSGTHIVFAGSVASPPQGPIILEGLPTEMPTGVISIYVFANQFDTNDDREQGVVALGGDKLISSQFSVNIEPQGGGAVSNSPMNWPVVNGADENFAYCNFDTTVFGSIATALNIDIQGQNNEQVPLTVHFDVSLDSTLSFSETVAVGATYQKHLSFTPAQTIDNDFLIRIIKAS